METAEFVRTVVNKYPLPLVLDADGLNALAGQMDLFRQDIRPPGATVFTPHPGEMARLTGRTIAEIQSNRVEVAREFARKYGITLILKGYRTLTASPDGQVWVNPTGNPGMAKGGTGDVLTGILAGRIAQSPTHPMGEVAAAAVYLHGLAGDIAAEGDLGNNPCWPGICWRASRKPTGSCRTTIDKGASATVFSGSSQSIQIVASGDVSGDTQR